MSNTAAGLLFLLSLVFSPLGRSVVLSVPDRLSGAGASTVSNVSLSTGGERISGLQFDLEWDAGISPQTALGAQIGSSGKQVYTATLSSRSMRFLIVGTDQSTFSDGELVNLIIGSVAGEGSFHLNLTNAFAADPDGLSLAVQTVSGAIRIDASGAMARLLPQGILNAASLLGGPIAPGEIVTLLGSFGIDPSSAGGVTLLVNDLSASILYAGGDQVNATVPFGIDVAGPATLDLRLEGRRVAEASVPAGALSPGVFTQGGTGVGPGAILNQDFTLNSANNAAPRGSTVMIYGTGFGALTTPPADGQIAAGPTSTSLPVRATIGGIPAEVSYSGAAPGLPAGVVQVNVAVPRAAAPNPAAPLSLTVGNSVIPPGVVIAIR